MHLNLYIITLKLPCELGSASNVLGYFVLKVYFMSHKFNFVLDRVQTPVRLVPPDATPPKSTKETDNKGDKTLLGKMTC